MSFVKAHAKKIPRNMEAEINQLLKNWGNCKASVIAEELGLLTKGLEDLVKKVD